MLNYYTQVKWAKWWLKETNNTRKNWTGIITGFTKTNKWPIVSWNGEKASEFGLEPKYIENLYQLKSKTKMIDIKECVIGQDYVWHGVADLVGPKFASVRFESIRNTFRLPSAPFLELNFLEMSWLNYGDKFQIIGITDFPKTTSNGRVGEVYIMKNGIVGVIFLYSEQLYFVTEAD